MQIPHPHANYEVFTCSYFLSTVGYALLAYGVGNRPKLQKRLYQKSLRYCTHKVY